jgi:hypothetical protein
MDNIYLTEYDKDGLIYAGPRISARTQKEAEKKAQLMQVRVIGRLVFEFENFEMN